MSEDWRKRAIKDKIAYKKDVQSPAQEVLPRRVQLTDAANPDWKELYSKLWEERQGYDRFRGHFTYHQHQPEKARLSQAGWDQIKQIIKDRGITVSVENACSGFSCALLLWHPREETYPGAEIEPRWLMTICSHMLPGDGRSGFADGWAEFSPLFNSPENIERLKWSKMELPRPASAYDY